MNCKNTKYNLMAFIENELTMEENMEIKTHIENCKTCSDLFSDFSETYKSINIGEYIEPKAFFAESVLSKIYREEELIEADTNILERLYTKYFKEIAYSGLAVILIMVAVFYLSEGTLSFNLSPDNDLISSGDFSSFFFDN